MAGQVLNDELDGPTYAGSIVDRLSVSVQELVTNFQKVASTTFNKDGKSYECLYLVKAVVPPPNTVGIGDDDIARFSRLMTHLITNGMVGHASLCDPVAMPLTGGRWALIWYVFSDHTREAINEHLGCECFVEEGGLYQGPWPEVCDG